jgi:UDP-N-acetylmuramoyl-tripeptide--D-alanyl-D-alanine ligase
MASPQIGVVTNIGVSHLELLGSREAIAEAKAELLSSLADDGVAVLNADDEFFEFLRKRSPGRVVSFGRHADADARADGVEVSADGSVQFTLRGWWGEHRVSLHAAGRHQACNAAAAAAAAMALGADSEWITPGLASFEGADMRLRIARAPAGFTVIDDCYNAAPDSVKVAIELLADLPGERRWAVLGEMKELGPLAPEWHAEMGQIASDAGLAGLITLGSLGHHIAEAARRRAVVPEVVEAADGREAAAILGERLGPGDVVLIKGSRAMRMEEIVRRLLQEPEQGEGRGQ